jgi:hypothetical protein
LRGISLYTHQSTGDTVQFAEYVERNIRLYQIRNTYALRPSAAASWIRRALATSLRTRKAYSVNLLVGGYDTASYDPHLYWIDHFGTMTEVPFAAHGYGAYFALSLLDRCGVSCCVFTLADAAQVPRPGGAARGGAGDAKALHRRGVQAPGHRPGQV